MANFLLVPDDGESLESDNELDKNWLALSRLMSSGDDEARAYVRQYLKEQRQRKQKESAILEQLASSTGDVFGRQSPRTQDYQEREAYVLVGSPTSSARAKDLNDLELSSSGDVETSQSNIVVVAPSGSEPSQDNQQNEQRLSVDNYELIKTLLADKTNADDEQELVGLNQKWQDDQLDLGQQDKRHTLTTLLEDEQQDGAGDKEETKTSATETTTATYEEIVYGQAPVDRAPTAMSSLWDLLGRMWNNLTYYLPFLDQFAFWSQDVPKASGQEDSNELHAKQSVSVTMAQNKSVVSDLEDGQSEENEINDKHQKSDSKENANTKNEHQQQQRHQENREANNDNDDFSGQFAPVKEPTDRTADGDDSQSKHEVRKNSNSKRVSSSLQLDDGRDLDMDMNQMVRMVASGGGSASGDQGHDDYSQDRPNENNRYNLMRHSSLVVPLGSAQDVLLRAGLTKEPSDSLLGKYIYAPTQHYYLNSGSGHHVPASVSGKRPQPEPVEEIYGSYGGANNGATYAAYQKDSAMSSISNKSNDLYFLIMVGAFCMMAMAVVLAAGMFAYRVQQHRKSSQDQDYPTYGVVGPNNLSGAKCGAAAFVGGYFNGPSGGSGKSGSVKHLPDLYHHHGASAGGSDSGLNSLDKSSAAAKKASSASSLSEHNHQNGQTTGSRTTPSNFMVAAGQDAARMYHYQHQKQQMISDRNSGGRHTSASDLDSEDENDDGSYTVYECPGLASAHEMEIKNPLFNDDQSP